MLSLSVVGHRDTFPGHRHALHPCLFLARWSVMWGRARLGRPPIPALPLSGGFLGAHHGVPACVLTAVLARGVKAAIGQFLSRRGIWGPRGKGSVSGVLYILSISS